MATQMAPRTPDRVLHNGFPQRGKTGWDAGKWQKPRDGDVPETPKEEDLGGMLDFVNVGAWRASRMTTLLVFISWGLGRWRSSGKC